MKNVVKFLFLFWVSFIWAEDIEVRVPTRTELRPLYVSQVSSLEGDPRLFEEARKVLLFDLSAGGFVSLVERDMLWDEGLERGFEAATWKNRKIPYVLSLSSSGRSLQITVYDVLKGSVRQYPPIELTGRIDSDRLAIHKFSDKLHQDLFGIEGIASLRILYSEKRTNPRGGSPEWVSEIWVRDADGAREKQLTHSHNYCISPGFLPGDKSGFYYVSFEKGQSKIYRATFSNPNGNVWISLRGNQTLPTLSRRARQIAFITDVAGRPDLFTLDLDSTFLPKAKAKQLFSAPRATQASPTYSPDGKKLAFVSDKDGPPRIYVIDVASPKETRRPVAQLITKRNRENTSPAWSPDGKRLAYSARTDGIRQIWIYDFDQNEEWQLTQGPENKENPAWAPDSLHLAYNTESNESCELFLINLRNPEPIQITNGSGLKRFPSWELP